MVADVVFHQFRHQAVDRSPRGRQTVKNLRAVLMFVEGAFHRLQLANHLFRAVDQIQLFS